MKVSNTIKGIIKKNISQNRHNAIVQNYTYKRYKKKNEVEAKLLLNNNSLKDIHKGKRCFIIGNGPSLKEQNLGLLEDEYVFTVNQIARNKDFEKIKTNYHFWADSIFFKDNEGEDNGQEIVDIMKGINTKGNRPKCFFPIEQIEFARKFELDKHLDLAYFKIGLEVYEKFDEDINFSKFVPGFHTVVQYAIAMAIYMGFSEIYLLGCDCTGIVTNITLRCQEEFTNEYAYEVTDTEKQRMKNRNAIISMEAELYSFYRIFRDYRVLNEYCNGKNIKLINCTGGGVLDCLAREDYKKVILENQKENNTNVQ